MTAPVCRVLGCGSLDTHLDVSIAGRAAWVQVRTNGVTPPRWYCTVVCAAAALLSDAGPLVLVWDGMVDLPAAGAPGTRVRVGAITTAGVPAVLEVAGDQRAALAGLLDAQVRDVRSPCPVPGCGTGDDLDPDDPALWGWTRVEVAGTEAGPRWYCSAPCVHDAMARAGVELAAVDQAAGHEPAGAPAGVRRPPHEDESLPPVLREALAVMARRGPVVELTARPGPTTAPSEGVPW